MFFKPKLLTNQVKVTLFLGMTLILLPFYLLSAGADPGTTNPPVSRPQIESPVTPPPADPSSATDESDPDSSPPARVCEIA